MYNIFAQQIQNEKQVEENELKLDQLKIKAEDRIREVESLLNEETRKSDQISERLTEASLPAKIGNKKKKCFHF